MKSYSQCTRQDINKIYKMVEKLCNNIPRMVVKSYYGIWKNSMHIHLGMPRGK